MQDMLLRSREGSLNPGDAVGCKPACMRNEGVSGNVFSGILPQAGDCSRQLVSRRASSVELTRHLLGYVLASGERTAW